MRELPNIQDIVSVIDNYKEEDELDLVKLVSTNANDANQYLLFLGSDNQYYAKNVSKIEELFVYSGLDIAKNNDNDKYIVGTANIRGIMTPIVKFDQWMGNEVLNDSEYELVIIASYGGKRFALVVKEVEYIITIDSTNMTANSESNSKSSFISSVTINSKEKLCTIFDGDMLLFDIFDNIEKQSNMDTKNIFSSSLSKKIILFADDSRYIRRLVEKLFIQLECNYKIYNDGKNLIEDLENIDTQNIGLFITDLEMPGASGKEVIEFIRKNNNYEDIKILVHTNMSSDTMEVELKNSGVAKIIGKVDIVVLSKAIQEFIR